MHSQENMDEKGRKAKSSSSGRAGAWSAGRSGHRCHRKRLCAKDTSPSLGLRVGHLHIHGSVDLPDVGRACNCCPSAWRAMGHGEPDATGGLTNLIAVASDGRIYVAGGTETGSRASTTESGVTDVSPDGIPGQLAGSRPHARRQDRRRFRSARTQPDEIDALRCGRLSARP